MGMFDWIEVEDEFLKHIPSNVEGISIHDLRFQTKSLSNTLSLYLIKKDGLFLVERDQDEQEKNLKNLNFHGILDFCGFYSTDLVNYLYDFQAKYTDGNLMDIKLVSFQESFHESKKERLEALIKKQKQHLNSGIFSKFLLNKLSCFLGIFGFEFKQTHAGALKNQDIVIHFFCPRLVLLSKDKFAFSVGPFLERIDTGIKYTSSLHEKSFAFKILGFGFSASRHKPLSFDKFDD